MDAIQAAIAHPVLVPDLVWQALAPARPPGASHFEHILEIRVEVEGDRHFEPA